MDDKELSAEDLREKLFHTFQSRGVLESLKSQLRNRLVNELQQTAKANLANGKKKIPEEPLLFYHAANSLVADHLEKCNFDYTLSVFLPESGTSKDKMYTVSDLLHLLKVDKESQLYKSLESSLSSRISQKSLLWEIVAQFSALCGHNKQSTMVQTDDNYSVKSPSVAEKLKFVDKAFSGQAERDNESWSVQSEQKIIEFQRKCEERKKVELMAEIQRFKSSELSRMRIEEKENCQKAIKLAKEQMEKDYSLKAESLRLKDRELTEREDNLKKNQEHEAYAQRQKILEEMQNVKERENDFKRKQELQESSLKLEEDKIKVEADKLKEKEMNLKEQESRVHQKIEDEIQRYKLHHQESYQKRLYDLELREAQLRQDKQNFDSNKAQYLRYYDELEETKEQLRKVQSQHEASKFNIATLQQQKDSVLNKLNQVKDYASLKERESYLQAEKTELQRLLEEERSKEQGYKATIKELKDKNSKPSSELVSLRNELKVLKDDAKNKEKLSKERQKKLEVRLQQESHRCIEYQRLYEEGLLKQKEMEKETEDIRAALHHTQTLLRMELERRRFSETSVSDVSLSSIPPEPAAVAITTECPGRPRQTSEMSGLDDTVNTQELIANSKQVFDKLEKDAKDLQESYRRFQSRMKNTGLEQFTSIHPMSLEKHVTFPGSHVNSVGVQPQKSLDSIQAKPGSQQEQFVPLSWIPASESRGPTMSYVTSGHVGVSLETPQFAPSLRPREDTTNTDSDTRFYSLPSFGVSELTQNTPTQRYLGMTTANRRPPNNTVNISDLIAKPGSPSVISAPIDHSTIPSSITITNNSKQEGSSYSSGEMTRRPLSSTINRATDETGTQSRDTGFLTSSNVQKGSSHVPVIDGSVFHGRKSDTDSENESHRSSDASLSAGYLSMGTLYRPAKTTMGPKQHIDIATSGKNNQIRRSDEMIDQIGGNVGTSDQMGRNDETNDPMGRNDGTNDQMSRNDGTNDQMGRNDGTNDQMSRNDGTSDQMSRNVGTNDQISRFDATNDSGKLSLDDAWRGTVSQETHEAQTHGGSSASAGHTYPEVVQPVSLDSAWKGGKSTSSNGNDSYAREERDRLEREQHEHEKRDQHRVELEKEREKREQERINFEIEREKREREEREREEREREERAWQEEQRKREELRRKREEEEWEREQRELAELQRQQEIKELERRQEQESSNNMKPESPKDEKKEQEAEDKGKELDIDPVMLQYMQMIQKKKEEEKVKAVETEEEQAKDKTDSQSFFSNGGNEGSLDGLSGDDGFDWG